MDAFVRTIAAVSRALGVFSALLLAVSILVITDAIVERSVLGVATIWQNEFVTYAVVAATFLGCPYVLLTRGHVNVDILPHYLGQAARFRLAMLSAVMSLCFSLAMTWLAWHYWSESWTGNWVSDTMWRVRLWIPFAAMPLGFAVLTLQYIVDVYCLAIGRDLPFGIQAEHEGEPA